MKYDAVITRVVKESPNISTVYFTIDGGIFAYTAGQYISVYFEQTDTKSGKAYSLSSAPTDSELSITVKNIGEFSGLICSLKPDDNIQISSPFGYFNVQDTAPIVAIAAGVGVSPIWSIIRDELFKSNKRHISLYLSAGHDDELVFHNDVDMLFSGCTNASAHYFVTQEVSRRAEHRRFAVEADLSQAACSTSQFYICGSESFVRGIWQQLRTVGVNEKRIVTETFFESSI